MNKPRFAPALSSLELIHQGKTRDTFPTKDSNKMLIVATDRLSTHNIIHESIVPRKGEVLTALTVFWLIQLLEKAGIRHHLVAYGTRIYDYLPGSRSDYPADLHLHAIVVEKLKMIPVEFIFRGYLAGSLWKSFYSKQIANPYNIVLDPGLPLMTKLEPPIFTPTDKSETDDPLDSSRTYARHREATDIAQKIYSLTRAHLNRRGFEEVDTKLELGVNEKGEIAVGDEIVTPDSSRFCPLSEIKEGQEPPWLDKQIARNEAERIWGAGEKRPLTFSPGIIQRLTDTYLQIFFMIAQMDLAHFQQHQLEMA